MTNTATAAQDFKLAFVSVARALWTETEPEVLVTFGHPGMNAPNDIVAFLDLTSSQEPGPMGPRRARDETLTINVQFSIFRGGRGDEVETMCSARAYKLLDDLETYVRVTDTTLGGVVRHCFLTSHTSEGATEPQIISKGRLIDVTAVFTALTRITS